MPKVFYLVLILATVLFSISLAFAQQKDAASNAHYLNTSQDGTWHFIDDTCQGWTSGHLISEAGQRAAIMGFSTAGIPKQFTDVTFRGVAMGNPTDSDVLIIAAYQVPKYNRADDKRQDCMGAPIGLESIAWDVGTWTNRMDLSSPSLTPVINAVLESGVDEFYLVITAQNGIRHIESVEPPSTAPRLMFHVTP